MDRDLKEEILKDVNRLFDKNEVDVELIRIASSRNINLCDVCLRILFAYAKQNKEDVGYKQGGRGFTKAINCFSTLLC